MLPLCIWIMILVGGFTAEGARDWADPVRWVVIMPLLLVLGGSALIQLLEVPLRTTIGQAIFRLAVVNARGEPAGIAEWLVRWAVVWLPLLVAMAIVARWSETAENVALIAGALLLLLWITAAACAVLHPNRGLHDRVSGTWVVRR